MNLTFMPQNKEQQTISFDFDFTLWDDDAQEFILETVILLRNHLAQADRVIIVTSRVDNWIPECHELLARLELKLEVFSAPGHPDWDTLLTKSDVLIAQNAIKHYDDTPNWEGLRAAKEAGIEILLPPAITAHKTSGKY